MDITIYEGQHSIDITVQTSPPKFYNTWSSWMLVPKGKLVVSPPEIKTEYIDLPGENGSLDFTGMLAGVKFKDRSGSWEFYVFKENYEKEHPGKTIDDLYSEILNAIHGKKVVISLNDDPNWTYEGRISLSDWKPEDHYTSATINYLLKPYKNRVLFDGDTYTGPNPAL